MNTSLVQLQCDWLWWLGPAAVAVILLFLIAHLLKRFWQSGRRWAVAAVLAIVLMVWPSAWYASNYQIRFEEVCTLWPLKADSGIRLTSPASPRTAGRVAQLSANGFQTYLQWDGLYLPPGRMYFLEIDMAADAGHLSRLERAGPDRPFSPSRRTGFRGVVKYTGVTPKYDGAFHRYFVIIGEHDYSIEALRLYPTNAPAAVALRSARVVALP